MSETKPLRLWDRSRATTDWTCPRKRFWNYEFRNRGIVPVGTKLEFFTGIVLHDCLAAIAHAAQHEVELDIKDLARNAYDQMVQALCPPRVEGEPLDLNKVEFAREQATLVQGLILGFYKHAWPRILAEYPKVVVYEAEMEKPGERLDLDPPLLFMSKPDVILESMDGRLAYLEYKSTSSKKPEWISSWETAVQLHSTIKAVKHTLGLEVDHVVVQGLYKGYESYGKQGSPFCYYYRREGHPPFSKSEISYEYRAGMRRYPVWELEGGVESWVASMPDYILAQQFPRTPPIFINEDLVAAFFRQREARERAILIANELLKKYASDPEMTQYIMDTEFPQRFDQCSPAWGYGCEYKGLCHGPEGDPLQHGYEWREPHHAREAEAFRERYVEAPPCPTS